MAHTYKKQSQQQSSSTFLQLSQHGDACTFPSTFNYKERTELKQKQAYEYGRIYNHTTMRGMTVYDRLTSDARVRQTLKAVTTAAASPAADSSSCFSTMAHAAAVTAAAAAAAGADRTASAGRKPGVMSGFVHNNNPNITCKQAAGDTACSTDPPLSALHPITLRSYYKKFPLDFLAAARPNVRTTNETLRMLGTYQGDEALAQRLGVHISHGSSCAALTRQ